MSSATGGVALLLGDKFPDFEADTTQVGHGGVNSSSSLRLQQHSRSVRIKAEGERSIHAACTHDPCPIHGLFFLSHPSPPGVERASAAGSSPRHSANTWWWCREITRYTCFFYCQKARIGTIIIRGNSYFPASHTGEVAGRVTDGSSRSVLVTSTSLLQSTAVVMWCVDAVSHTAVAVSRAVWKSTIPGGYTYIHTADSSMYVSEKMLLKSHSCDRCLSLVYT